MLATGAFGQTTGSASGVVTRDGTPAAGVRVTLRGSDDRRVTAIADADGRFQFAAVAAGSYLLEAENTAVRITVRPGLEAKAELALDLLKEAVTISADAPQPIDEISKTVNVISGQQMRERADIALVDSVRSMPGFRVQQLGGFGRTAMIKTRGLRNQDTAILIDGIRFRDAAAINGDVGSFLSDITLTSVSRLEVLRGSGTSLYGTNAIGGTVNLITPEAAAGWHGQVQVAGGQLGFGRFRGVTSYGAKDGVFGFTIGGSRTVLTKGIDGNDDAENTNIQPRLDIKLSPRTNVSAKVFFSDAEAKLNVSPDTFGSLPAGNSTIIDAAEGVNFLADLDDPDSTQRNRAINGSLSFAHTFNECVWVNGYYAAMQTKRRNIDGPLGPGWQSPYRTDNHGMIHTANMSVNFAFKGNTIKAGYEFESEKYRTENTTPSGFEDNWLEASQVSNSVFVQDVVSLLGGRLQFVGGLRGQWFSLRRPQFSLENSLYRDAANSEPPAAATADGAASYHFRSTGTKLRIHVGTGYRIPSLYERFGSTFSTWPTAGFAALGDPTLTPERSTAFDAGIEQSIFDGKARFTAAYFYTRLRDVIGFGTMPPTDPNGRAYGYRNEAGGLARGVELSFEARPTRSTDIFTSYTFTNGDQRQPQVAGSGIIDTLGIPRDQFTLVATQRFKRFWINADLLIASSYLAPMFSSQTFGSYVYRFDGNRRLDLTAGYTFPVKERYSVRVFAMAENVFDQKYFENGFRTPRANVRGGVNFAF